MQGGGRSRATVAVLKGMESGPPCTLSAALSSMSLNSSSLKSQDASSNCSTSLWVCEDQGYQRSLFVTLDSYFLGLEFSQNPQHFSSLGSLKQLCGLSPRHTSRRPAPGSRDLTAAWIRGEPVDPRWEQRKSQLHIFLSTIINEYMR